jgi:DNA polymerase III sliding clamp (beta) subunit (PCNA family)
VLKNVLLIVSGAGTELVGTDQETGLRYRVNGVETNSEGEVLLPTQKLAAILRELQCETFELQVDDRTIVLKAGLPRILASFLRCHVFLRTVFSGFRLRCCGR